MKKAQITRRWVVYPPNYNWRNNDKFYHVPFLKDACNKACSLGEGAEVCERVEQVYRDGAWSSSGGRSFTVVKRKRSRYETA